MKLQFWFLSFATFFCVGTMQSAPIRNIPWLTDGAIAFLNEYFTNHPQAKVLEFGSGASTAWLASRAGHLVSVEHDDEWYQFVVDNVKQLQLEKKPLLIRHDRPYHSVCKRFEPEFFDLILVDGRDRMMCLEAALPLLKKGGILMLDDSARERYHIAFKWMKGWPYYAAKQSRKSKFYVCGWQTSWWIKPTT